MPRAGQAAEPLTSEAFATWMAELDALQTLRFQDPAAALERLAQRRGQWPPLAPAEDALLHARCTLHAGAASLALGQHTQAAVELQALEAQLAAPLLAQSSGELQRQTQRCGIAGANARAVLEHALGNFAGALQAYLGALERARQVGDARYEAHLRVNLANTYEECGLPAEALEQLRQALQLAESLGMDELVGDIHHNIGNALVGCGDAEAGLASNERALQAYTRLQLPQKEGYALVAVAERLLELGRPDDAAARLLERESRPGGYVNQQYLAYAAYLGGRIAVAQGRASAARQAFETALAISTHPLGDRVGQARARLELARLHLGADEIAAARQQAESALALLQPSQATRDLMQAHRLLSTLAKTRGDLHAALAHHEDFHAAYERCFNEESARKAQLLAVRHQVDLAQAEAQRARLENARLAEALAEIGARLQAGAGTGRSGADQPARAQDLQALGLTPREAEVLFWVTQGKTNEDVMDILGISLSAVKKHLGHIYEKLGVENRTAAANAARARQRG